MTNDSTIRLGSRVILSGLLPRPWPTGAVDVEFAAEGNNGEIGTVIHLFEGETCPMVRVVWDGLAEDADHADGDGMPTVIAWDGPVACVVEVSR
jgi:hypothetical protein